MTPKERLRARIAPQKPPAPMIDYIAQDNAFRQLRALEQIQAAVWNTNQQLEKLGYDIRNMSGPLFCLPGIADRTVMAVNGLMMPLVNIDNNTRPFKRKKKCRRTKRQPG